MHAGSVGPSPMQHLALGRLSSVATGCLGGLAGAVPPPLLTQLWRPTSKWARCSMAGIGTVEAIGLSPPKVPVRPRLPRRPKLSLFSSARPKSPLAGKADRSSPEVAASSFPAVKRGLGRPPAQPQPWKFVADSFSHGTKNSYCDA